jgi:hypothetical protein
MNSASRSGVGVLRPGAKTVVSDSDACPCLSLFRVRCGRDSRLGGVRVSVQMSRFAASHRQGSRPLNG